MNIPLHYAVAPGFPIINGSSDNLLILLHGFGANEYDLLPLATSFRLQCPCVSLRGPIILGNQQFAWYNLELEAGAISYEIDEVDSAIDLVEQSINDLLGHYELKPQSIFLLGFSQGAGIALATSLTRPTSVNKVVASSMLWPDGYENDILPTQRDLVDCLLIHGISDQIISIEAAKMNNNLLAKQGVKLHYEEFQMGHEISPASVQSIAKFLKS